MLMQKPLQSQPMQNYLSYPAVENALTLVCFIGGEPLNLVDAENLEYWPNCEVWEKASDSRKLYQSYNNWIKKGVTFTSCYMI